MLTNTSDFPDRGGWNGLSMPLALAPIRFTGDFQDQINPTVARALGDGHFATSPPKQSGGRVFKFDPTKCLPVP